MLSASSQRISLVGILGAVLISVVPVLVGCGTPVTIPALTTADIPRLEAAANHPHQVYRFEPGDTIRINYTFHSDMN